jgi:16S rRNA (cytosine1402-N4)-methyltransferase
MGNTHHIPVLLDEVVQNLIRPEYRLFVDATVGGGGHTYSILTTYPNLRAYAIDLDDIALQAAADRLAPFQDRVTVKRANFSELKQILSDEGVATIDAVLFDLGVSTFQLEGERGFSFRDTCALDMRMDQRQPVTAFHVVNAYPYEELKRIIAEYGEEWKAAPVARAIVAERKKAPIITARALADVVAKVVRRRGKTHPATKTFQAIRMEVNKEIERLEAGLEAAINLLAPGGRLGVISFHSLDDRLVKTTFKTTSGLSVITKKPIRPGRPEVVRNPRSRSAKLRIAEKVKGVDA